MARSAEQPTGLFRSLRNLRADEILKLEEADELFKDAATYAAETEGATYRIEIGAAQAERGNGRPVRIEATGDVAAATAKKLAGRAFLVPPYLGDALVAQRDALVRKVEPVSTEPAAEEPADEESPAVAGEVSLPEPPPVPEAAVAAETEPGEAAAP